MITQYRVGVFGVYTKPFYSLQETEAYLSITKLVTGTVTPGTSVQISHDGGVTWAIYIA